MRDYQEFLDTKRITAPRCGFEIEESELPKWLFPIQAKTAHWALWRGRADVLLETGLGKSAIELVFSHEAVKRTGKPALLVCPLGVAQQLVREGERFGIPTVRAKHPSFVQHDAVNVTNYERLHLFDPSDFGALATDEAGILKGGGPVVQSLIEFGGPIAYRIGATATPAPNETMELVNHAAYLGIMEPRECMATFFQQDGNTTNKWRLKNHARRDWWDWVSTWAAAARKPSDWGLSDDGYELPALTINDHSVQVPLSLAQDQGVLFVMEAHGITDQRQVKRSTLKERCGLAVELARASQEPFIIWAELNEESATIAKLLGDDAVEVTGSMKDDDKEARLEAFSTQQVRGIVTKGRLAGWGLNWQHAGTQIHAGRTNSYEMLYQCIRRSWRFGRKAPVDVHMIGTEADGQVIRNMARKTTDATEMMDELVAAVKRNGLVCKPSERDEWNYRPQQALRLPSWL